MKQTGNEVYKKIRSSHKFLEEHPNPHNSLSSENIKRDIV